MALEEIVQIALSCPNRVSAPNVETEARTLGNHARGNAGENQGIRNGTNFLLRRGFLHSQISAKSSNFQVLKFISVWGVATLTVVQIKEIHAKREVLKKI